PTILTTRRKRKISNFYFSFLSLFSPIQILNNAKNHVHVSLHIIDARCVERPAPKTTDLEEHRMERKANNLGCGASLDDGEERND
ncbi:hypothetical protein FOC1_g10009226, partial [Fusarium oxysporum f. sp. cubense race 1]